jgi:hypothetical protein
MRLSANRYRRSSTRTHLNSPHLGVKRGQRVHVPHGEQHDAEHEQRGGAVLAVVVPPPRVRHSQHSRAGWLHRPTITRCHQSLTCSLYGQTVTAGRDVQSCSVKNDTSIGCRFPDCHVKCFGQNVVKKRNPASSLASACPAAWWGSPGCKRHTLTHLKANFETRISLCRFESWKSGAFLTTGQLDSTRKACRGRAVWGLMFSV